MGRVGRAESGIGTGWFDLGWRNGNEISYGFFGIHTVTRWIFFGWYLGIDSNCAV